ncbi:coiled-coil domain-containing protein 13 [Ctenocephalides felis]|uniref:coiled-coil domain-containing protein 13 n=1 Tax=Ctenocephalides felis TaxID=7515 RepID=UPI000E6E1ACE|nr:coiled-coil domain-containing protein 13 [Ctenocephalides felis]
MSNDDEVDYDDKFMVETENDSEMLSQQNDDLKAKLDLAKIEIKKLHQRTERLQDLVKKQDGRIYGGSDIASAKLVELSKKNRNLHAELESTKMRYSSVQARLEESQSRAAPPPAPDPPASVDAAQQEAIIRNLQAEVATLREQVSLAKQRMFETRNQNLALRAELKQTQRLLQQEVGDGLIMQGNTPTLPSTWRGRAQQIIALQNKISDLQHKCGQTTATEQACVSTLRHIEQQRRTVQENTAKELAAARADLDGKDQIINALKARCRTLESENDTRKKRVKTLLEKASNDNQYIHAIQAELNTLKQDNKGQKSSSQENASTSDCQRRHVPDQDKNAPNDHYQSIAEAAESERQNIEKILSITHERLNNEVRKSVLSHKKQEQDNGISMNPSKTYPTEVCRIIDERAKKLAHKDDDLKASIREAKEEVRELQEKAEQIHQILLKQDERIYGATGIANFKRIQTPPRERVVSSKQTRQTRTLSARQEPKKNMRDFSVQVRLELEESPRRAATPPVIVRPKSADVAKQKVLIRDLEMLSQQNDDLKAKLDLAKIEIKKLHQRTERLQDLVKKQDGRIYGGSDIASAKLVELSKKNRNLHAELESTKMRYSSVQARLEESQSRAAPPPAPDPPASVDAAQQEAIIRNLQAEVATLREQVSLAKQRMFETRNQNLALRAELKQTQRLLQQEVGDGLIMQGNTPALPSTWRGRAQQIIALQNKISDLQHKCGQTTATEQACVSTLRHIEQQRRTVQENTAKELAAARADLDGKDQIINALKARCRTLESENDTRKKRVKTLLEKASNDNQYIHAIQLNISQVAKKHSLELREKSLECDQLTSKIADLEAELNTLKQDNKGHKSSSQENASTSDCQRKHVPDQDKNAPNDHYQSIAEAAESERQNIEKILSITHERLNNEVRKSVLSHKSYLSERGKCAQLRSRLNILEQEFKKLRKRQHARMGLPIESSSSTGSVALQLEELRNKLQISEERSIALDERIESILQERSHDISRIEDMIKNTREIFKRHDSNS